MPSVEIRDAGRENDVNVVPFPERIQINEIMRGVTGLRRLGIQRIV